MISKQQVARLMAFETATLAIMAVLHLTGLLGGGSKPFDHKQAGIAEAIICAVLAYGVYGLVREPPHRSVALVTVAFAILGFIIGLVFTLQGSDAIDLAYHLTMFPLLVLTLLALRRTPIPRRRHA